MPRTEPAIRTINTADARRQFEALLRQVAEGQTQAVIEEGGRPLAALISIDDLRRLQRDKDFDALGTFARAFEDVPIAKLEQEVEKAFRQSRAERRKQRQQSPSGK